MKLYIGNKNYSSWSFRPWIGLTQVGIDFEEVQLWFDFPGGNIEIKSVSPTGKVPLLVDGDLIIPESLAILDHVARKYRESGLWPENQALRSRAMAMACEMVGGFSALRTACPMNIRRVPNRLAVDSAVLADVARIQALWAEALAYSGGPFLCGSFSIADAMYAPVVNRLEIYGFELSSTSRQYMDRIKSLKAWKEWEIASRAEKAVIAADEV